MRTVQQERRTRLLHGLAQSQPSTEHHDGDRLAAAELREEILRVLAQQTEQERLALEWFAKEKTLARSASE